MPRIVPSSAGAQAAVSRAGDAGVGGRLAAGSVAQCCLGRNRSRIATGAHPHHPRVPWSWRPRPVTYHAASQDPLEEGDGARDGPDDAGGSPAPYDSAYLVYPDARPRTPAALLPISTRLAVDAALPEALRAAVPALVLTACVCYGSVHRLLDFFSGYSASYIIYIIQDWLSDQVFMMAVPARDGPFWSLKVGLLVACFGTVLLRCSSLPTLLIAYAGGAMLGNSILPGAGPLCGASTVCLSATALTLTTCQHSEPARCAAAWTLPHLALFALASTANLSTSLKLFASSGYAYLFQGYLLLALLAGAYLLHSAVAPHATAGGGRARQGRGRERGPWASEDPWF